MWLHWIKNRNTIAGIWGLLYYILNLYILYLKWGYINFIPKGEIKSLKTDRNRVTCIAFQEYLCTGILPVFY